MKKILVCSIIGLTLIISGCEKNFDPNIYGSLFPANFPKTEAEVESFFMTCYVPFMSPWTYNFGGNSQGPFLIPHTGYIRQFDSTTDYTNIQTTGGWGGEWERFSRANFTNCINWSRTFSDGAPIHFEKIRQITRFTSILDVVEKSTFLSETKMKNFTGEVRLLRGLMMYYLFHIYGPVPVILDPNLIGDDEAEKNLVRPSLEQMVQYIYDDFDYAVKNMNHFNPNTVRGRYTADYARVCLMRHCLNEGSYMPNYYDKAIEMYNELKNSTAKTYSLYVAGGADAYANQFKQGFKFNSEVIMAFSVGSTNNANTSNTRPDYNPINNYVRPQTRFYQDRTLPNGEPNPLAPPGGGNARPGWGQYFNISPLWWDSYEPGDVRRNVIVHEYYENIAGGTLRTRADCNISFWSGFILNKYPAEIDTENQPTDVPLARWADVLLMYAEAVARKTQAVPTGEALDGVNAVRARAQLEPLSGEAIASYEGFMEALLMERGHEFLFEGLRKIDLIRFNKYRHNVRAFKGMNGIYLDPTVEILQYQPLPNYARIQAEESGRTLAQFFARPGYELDN